MKIFKNKATALAAIKRQAIVDMAWVYENHCSAQGTGIVIKIFVHDVDDANDVRARGFLAEINPEKAAG